MIYSGLRQTDNVRQLDCFQMKFYKNLKAMMSSEIVENH